MNGKKKMDFTLSFLITDHISEKRFKRISSSEKSSEGLRS